MHLGVGHNFQPNWFRGIKSLSSASSQGPLPPGMNSTGCPQWGALHPVWNAELNADLERMYASDAFRLHTYSRLSGAIRIPTESRDDSGPIGEDPVWEPFAEFHDYLEETFPLVYETLKVTKVNTYGLVFHWGGSTDAKPFLTTAHQDVVPIEPSTLSEWEHEPYSGYYDGTWIWGRGTCDDKAEVIERLIVVDSLLRRGFSPARTLVLAFGFDEETTGLEGAGHLAKYLEETYGRDGFAMILDEGDTVSDLGNGVYFASPAISEKGYMDVRVEVASPGGHSSVPPDHTSIGFLARLVTAIEDNPHVPQLSRTGTPFRSTICLADYSPSFPEELRSIARDAVFDDSALGELKEGLLKLSPIAKAMLATTQAVDIVEGGVKVNALPERASVIVNHRIGEHSSVGELQQHLTDILYPVVSKYDLTLNAFGRVVHTGQGGVVTLSDAYGSALEPSPVTPAGFGPYSILGGTIKATMESSDFYNVTSIVVAPSLSLVHDHLVLPDTMYYWNLTKHIFRFSPNVVTDRYNGEHTVNEALRAEAMIEAIRFYTKLILNLDESLLP
ncbi:carboxypeptidase S [Paxillus ammoniavirescens]|nr:carboxypeptidase S [Paxillus ammoniavirescens]